MLTVALIGPDGSGKSTLAHRLVECLPTPAVAIYMGVNPDESGVRSPLSRLVTWAKRRTGSHHHDAGPPKRPGDPASGGDRRGLRRVRREARSLLRALLMVTDELYRQNVVRRHRSAGRTVVLDRDFWADYRTHDIGNPGDLGRRVHGRFLERFYRKPDLFVYLDAPAETLHARKGEGTVELLRARQHDYLALAPSVARFEIVDVDRPVDDVVADLVALVTAAGQ